MIVEGESVPFWGEAVLCLEIPEDGASRSLGVGIKLHVDVLTHLLLHRRVPFVDEIDIAAAPTSRLRVEIIIAFISGSDAVSIESGGAVGHSTTPFPHYHPMVCVVRIRARVGAHRRDMCLCKRLAKSTV